MVNGTSALHTCLILAGVDSGDEVITQSLTFVATCNAISYQQAVPVFVDVERSTLGMCPEALSAFLKEHAVREDNGTCRNRETGRVLRACVSMHTFGHPCRIHEIKKVCEEWGLVLIEDAAESLGSFCSGVHTGNTGKLAALSFNGNKTITTGGGGMVMCHEEDVAQTARHLTTTAKQSHPYLYHHDRIGYNYRLPALNAALGCAQMERLPDFLENKRKTATAYRSWFKGEGHVFVDEPIGCQSNFWLNAFLCENQCERNEVLEQTNAAGVMTRPVWEPMHTLPMFRNCPRGPLSVTEWLARRLVNIPSSVKPA
jgi:aminotransferase in exopolysaccharide biosynthesis